MKAEKIRQIRKEKGMTQEELAKKVGVKRAVISKYESGSIEPSLTQLQKIADALEVPFGNLVLEENAGAYTAGIPAVDVPIYLKRISCELTWLSEKLDTTPEVIQSINEFGADYERAILAAVLYHGEVDIEGLRQEKTQQEQAYDHFYVVYTNPSCENEEKAAWQCCQKYSRKARELGQKIEDLERLNTQAVKLVERYRTKLDTAVDTRLITAFQALNETGREEAVKRVQELAELERYKK
jgi:transcriptional regulator with XRE-family HTH domain